MNWEQFFETSDIRILLFLHEKQQARYSELEKNVVKTRSVLSESMQDLTRRGLVDRRVETSKPIQTYYSLTSKGQKLVQSLIVIQRLLMQ